MQKALSHIADICFKSDIKKAIICPGSRNAPLINAFVKHPNIECFSVIDERSAGYVAIGMARVSKESIAVICTSGSAVANFYAAVTEAYHLPTSVLFITADRPAELQNAWDGQTIQQANIFDKNIQAQENISPEDLEFSQLAYQKTFHVCQKLFLGACHLNIQLREPLYIYQPSDFFPYQGKLLNELFILDKKENFKFNNGNFEKLKNALTFQKQIIWINGAAILSKKEQKILNEIFQRNKYFFISDIASSVHYLQSETYWEWALIWFLEEIKNELKDYILISTGTSHLSKNLKNLFRNHPPEIHFHIMEYGNISDQFFTNPIEIRESLETVSTLFLKELVSCELEAVPKETKPINTNINTSQNPLEKYGKLASLRLKKTQENIPEFWNEIDYCFYIFSQLKSNDVLHLSNSMPIRYASMFLHSKSEMEVYTNRGVSGIDGCVSAAVGAAKIDIKRRHVLLTGDIAFAYDNNVFWNNFGAKNLVIIILNNFGGGIFNIIAGPETIAETNKFIRTQHQQNFSNLAAYYGVDYVEINQPEKLKEVWEAISPMPNKTIIIEIKTNAETNAAYFNNLKKYI